MRRVVAPETSAVGSQLLNGNLAGSRPQRNDSLCDLCGSSVLLFYDHRFHQLNFVILPEGLRNALGGDGKRYHHRQRQQYVKNRPCHVGVEVSQSPLLHADESAD